MPLADSSSLDIVVIGAGLGGLAAAISCALGGHRITVLEQAKELAEVRPTYPTGNFDRRFHSTDEMAAIQIGAGLQITPK